MNVKASMTPKRAVAFFGSVIFFLVLVYSKSFYARYYKSNWQQYHKLIEEPYVRPWQPFTSHNNISSTVLETDEPKEQCRHLGYRYEQDTNELSVLNFVWRKLYSDIKARNVNDVLIKNSQNENFEEDYEGRVRSIPPLKPSDFSYEVKQHYNATHLCVEVNEKYKGMNTVGGASIGLAAFGTCTMDFTHLMDYLNGTLSGCVRIFELKLRVICTLYYRNFEAFAHRRAVKKDYSERLISSEVTLARNGKSMIIKAHKKMTLPANPSIEEKHFISYIQKGSDMKNIRERYVKSHEVCHVLQEARWVVYKSEWRLLYRGFIVAKPHAEKVRKCIMDYESITMVGDSHIASYHDYFMTFVNKPDPHFFDKLRFSHNSGHFKFLWRAKGYHFLMFLEEFKSSLESAALNGTNSTKSKTYKHGKLVVMGTGHHDLDIGGHDEKPFGAGLWFVNMQRTLKLLGEITALAREQNIRLLWVPQPSVSHKYLENNNKRNNFLLSALNQWLTPKLVALGVEVFNIYDLELPLSDQEGNPGHFLYVNNLSNAIKGTVGEVMVGLMATQVCPDIY